MSGSLAYLADNLAAVREDIRAAEERAGRVGKTTLIAAVKYTDAEHIAELVRLGVRDLGENRVQQLTEHAQALEQMGVEIDKVVNLIVPDEAITKRMSGRRVCAKCGASYHIINKPSAKEGVCDRCGGELAIRKDDEPATVLDRLKAYHEQTEPLVEFYRQRGKLVEVPDQGSIEATTAFLLKLLEA